MNHLPRFSDFESPVLSSARSIDRPWRATQVLASLLAVGIGLFSVAGCSQDADLEEPVESSGQELSGSCSSAFAGCVRGGGGGGCATRFCSGACVSEVERCARSGGGAACGNKCSAASACNPREEWTKVRTDECGISLPPFEGTTVGEAKATCTTQCNGSRTCSIWHDSRGRAQCTIGAPVDAAGNYW